LSNRKDGIPSLGTVILGKYLKDIKVYKASSIEVDLYEEEGILSFIIILEILKEQN
jgi:hypothetical protein